jgi:phage shock protein PspC (stress-responsive transcriptional regulator)
MSKKLARSRDDKWVAGVCGGLADYTGIDVNLVRLVVAVTAVFTIPAGPIAYVAAWVIMPKPAAPTWGPPPAP